MKDYPGFNKQREKFVKKIRTRNIIIDIKSMGFPGCISLIILIVLLLNFIAKLLGY